MPWDLGANWGHEARNEDLTDPKGLAFVFSWILENTEKTKATLEGFSTLIPRHGRVCCCAVCWHTQRHCCLSSSVEAAWPPLQQSHGAYYLHNKHVSSDFQLGSSVFVPIYPPVEVSESFSCKHFLLALWFMQRHALFVQSCAKLSPCAGRSGSSAGYLWRSPYHSSCNGSISDCLWSSQSCAIWWLSLNKTLSFWPKPSTAVFSASSAGCAWSSSFSIWSKVQHCRAFSAKTCAA